MKKIRSSLALAAAVGLALLAAACSSSDQNTSNQGKVSMQLTASGTAAMTTSGATSADGMQGLTSATITISAAQARDDSGTWVDVGGSYPVTVDLVALAQNGKTYTLPPDLLPAGHYTAIQITITAANLTLSDGTTVTITPPSGGWVVLIPTSFDVVAGQQTTIMLNLHMDTSFHFLNGQAEFDPDIECDGVHH